MSYIINTIEGNTPNCWKYWVNTPVNGNSLILGATLNFEYNIGKIILNNGSSFNGNGYSLNFTNIKLTGIQLFDLQGGIVSNISIGTSIGSNGILLMNTMNNNTSTIIDGNINISNYIKANNIIGNSINLNGNDLKKILDNKIDNSTNNMMFKINGLLK